MTQPRDNPDDELRRAYARLGLKYPEPDTPQQPISDDPLRHAYERLGLPFTPQTPEPVEPQVRPTAPVIDTPERATEPSTVDDAPFTDMARGRARLDELAGYFKRPPAGEQRRPWSGLLDAADLAQGGVELGLAALAPKSFNAGQGPMEAWTEDLGKYLGYSQWARTPLEIAATGGVGIGPRGVMSGLRLGGRSLSALAGKLGLAGKAAEAKIVSDLAAVPIAGRGAAIEGANLSPETRTLVDDIHTADMSEYEKAVRLGPRGDDIHTGMMERAAQLRGREPQPGEMGPFGVRVPERVLGSPGVFGVPAPGMVAPMRNVAERAVAGTEGVTSPGTVRLYRGQDKEYPIPGRWFTTDRNVAVSHGSEIRYVDVPEDVLVQLRKDTAELDRIEGAWTRQAGAVELPPGLAARSVRESAALPGSSRKRFLGSGPGQAERKAALAEFRLLADRTAEVEAAVSRAAGPMTPEQWALLKDIGGGKGNWRAFSEARGYTPEQMDEFQRFLDAVEKAKGLGIYEDALAEISGKAYLKYNRPLRPVAGGMDNRYIPPPSLMTRLSTLFNPVTPTGNYISATNTTGLAANPVLTKMREGLKSITPVIRENRALMKEQRGERITAYGRAQAGLGSVEARHIAGRRAGAGEFAKAEFEPLGSLFTPDERTALYDLVEGKPRMDMLEKARVKDTLQKLLDLGQVPEPNELASFRRVFGSTIPLPIKGGVVNEVLSTLKTIQTSFIDISPFGRQGLVLAPGRPIKAVVALKKGLHAAISVKAEDEAYAGLLARPNYPLYVRDDLHLTSAASEISNREIEVASNWIFDTKLPVLRQIGNTLALSKRFQYTFLNELRADTYDAYAAFLTRPGDTVVMHNVGHMVNAGTGRGSLPKVLADNPGLVNQAAYSLRYAVSRFEVPWASVGLATGLQKTPGKFGFTVAPSPKAALIMIKDFLAAAAAIGLMTSLFVRSGEATVNDDPDSPDFGKTKIGNIRLDPYAGFQQDVRLLVRLGDVSRMKRKPGESSEKRAKRVGAENTRIVGRFLRGKLGPGVSFIYDAFSGVNAVGEPVDLTNPQGVFKELLQLFSPLNVVDVVEGAQYAGIKGGLLGATSEIGVGVQTYKPRTNQGRSPGLNFGPR